MTTLLPFRRKHKSEAVLKLQDLPVVVLRKIIENLTVAEVLKFGLVSKRCREAANEWFYSRTQCDFATLSNWPMRGKQSSQNQKTHKKRLLKLASSILLRCGPDLESYSFGNRVKVAESKQISAKELAIRFPKLIALDCLQEAFDTITKEYILQVGLDCRIRKFACTGKNIDEHVLLIVLNNCRYHLEELRVIDLNPILLRVIHEFLMAEEEECPKLRSVVFLWYSRDGFRSESVMQRLEAIQTLIGDLREISYYRTSFDFPYLSVKL